MSNLQEWIEAALIVADGEDMPDSEVIPTWPADVASHYPTLTVGALREWQAARAQGDAEPVAVVELSDYIHLSGAKTSQRKALKETSEGSIQNLPEGTVLFTRPPSAGVPEGITVEMLEAIWQAGIDAENYDDRDFCDPLIRARVAIEESTHTTPQPAKQGRVPGGDAWVKCSERLPTKADADYLGQIWVIEPHMDYPVIWDLDVVLKCVKEFENFYFTWKPTGLKRPQPPQEGE